MSTCAPKVVWPRLSLTYRIETINVTYTIAMLASISLVKQRLTIRSKWKFNQTRHLRRDALSHEAIVSKETEVTSLPENILKHLLFTSTLTSPAWVIENALVTTSHKRSFDLVYCPSECTPLQTVEKRIFPFESANSLKVLTQFCCSHYWSFRRFTYGNLVTTFTSSKWSSLVIFSNNAAFEENCII